MAIYTDTQPIRQLEKRRGGYFYLTIPADVVAQWKDQRLTRLLCTLVGKITLRCGLNHLGDGNFFIIVSTKNLKAIHKQVGDEVYFEVREDPDPLGVKMPEVLKVLLEQDEALKAHFEKLSLGKRRHVIHRIAKIKDIDRQVSHAISIIYEQSPPRKRH